MVGAFAFGCRRAAPLAAVGFATARHPPDRKGALAAWRTTSGPLTDFGIAS